MTLKNLRYEHRCGKSWDVDVRAVEEAKAARGAFLSRQREGKIAPSRMPSKRIRGQPLAHLFPATNDGRNSIFA